MKLGRAVGTGIGIGIGVVLVIQGVLAASSWVTHHFAVTTSGSIVITESTPEVEAVYQYTIDSNVVVFGEASGATNQALYMTAQPIGIHNQGNQVMKGISITATGLPAWLSAGIDIQSPSSPGQLMPGESGTLIITLGGVPTVAGSIDLAGVSLEITPR